MDLRTFRADSLPEALTLVRRELGSHAAVLRTREITPGVLGWLRGARMIEVTASASIDLPSRLRRKATAPPEPPAARSVDAAVLLSASLASTRGKSPPRAEMARPRTASSSEPVFTPRRPPTEAADSISRPPAPAATLPPQIRATDHGLDLAGDGPALLARQVHSQLHDLQSMVSDLCRRSSGAAAQLSETMLRMYGELLDAEFAEPLALELVDRLSKSGVDERGPLDALKAGIAAMLAAELPTTGPIELTAGKQRLVALVGPTGVGKTTTIAKLAAHYRLRRNCRVGLITLDTYRIAAVEQLGAYAGMMDLPMVVVSTPDEMREAVAQLASMDLVLLDTAGRCARDERQIDELRTMLREASPDEVHLVLSSTANAASQRQTAERFAAAGATALAITKLDEATGLGGLPPLVRACRLPLSYVTHGQNVPADIAPADATALARRMVGLQ